MRSIDPASASGARTRAWPVLPWLALALAAAPWPGRRAQIAVSGNDNKRGSRTARTRVVRDAPRRTRSPSSTSAPAPPRVRGEVGVRLPRSSARPPRSRITPDERLALVTSNQRLDPADPGRLVPGQPHVGGRPARHPAARAGRRSRPAPAPPASRSTAPARWRWWPTARRARSASSASTANEADAGGQGRDRPVSAESAHVAFTPDGRHALVTRDGDHSVSVLRIEGETVTKTDRDITAGLRPYGMAITPDGRWAVVANIGRGTGDADTVTLIDLQPRALAHRATPSASARRRRASRPAPTTGIVAVTVINGSNKPAGSPFRGPGLVRMLRIDDGAAARCGEAPVGDWAQGMAFSRDGRTLLVATWWSATSRCSAWRRTGG